MILATSVLVGFALRFGAGLKLSGLARIRLRGESVLLAVLITQSLIPLLRLEGAAARLAFLVWLGTFPVLIAVSLRNGDRPGMHLLALGLALNLIVIAVNGGMPVDALAFSAAQGGDTALHIPATDFVHVAVTATTRLVWLGDVLPVPGPDWVRSVASVGDCLLAAGLASFVGMVRDDAERPGRGRDPRSGEVRGI